MTIYGFHWYIDKKGVISVAEGRGEKFTHDQVLEPISMNESEKESLLDAVRNHIHEMKQDSSGIMYVTSLLILHCLMFHQGLLWTSTTQSLRIPNTVLLGQRK